MVERDGVARVQIVHACLPACREIRYRGPQENVEVIVKQRPRQDLPATANRHAVQEIQPMLTVPVVADNHTTLPDASGDMTNAVLDIDAQKATHDRPEPTTQKLKLTTLLCHRNGTAGNGQTACCLLRKNAIVVG